MLLPLPPFLIKVSTNHPNKNHLRLPLHPSLSTTRVGSPVLPDPRSGWLSCPIALHSRLSCSHSGLGVPPLGHCSQRPCGLTTSTSGPQQGSPHTAPTHPVKQDSESATCLCKNLQGFTKPRNCSLCSSARKAHHDLALPTCPARSPAIYQHLPSQKSAPTTLLFTPPTLEYAVPCAHSSLPTPWLLS